MKVGPALIFIVSGFLGGLYWGRRDSIQPLKPLACEEPATTATTDATINTTANCAEMQEFKKQLSGISPEEIRKYLQIQEADQKLRKADEILGKIMQLLVAQVGFRLQSEELQQFGKIPEKAIDTQPAPAPVAQRAKGETSNSMTGRRPRFL